MAANMDPLWRFLEMGTGETFKNIVTAAAIIIGGFWAYFKLVKGRTFKPRLSVEMTGHWRTLDGVRNVFHLRIRITNIGASKVSLKQSGTGLRISLPADSQSDAPEICSWKPIMTTPENGKKRTFTIFKEHEWIEPGETISEDVLLNLAPKPTAAMLETRLVWRRGWFPKNNVVVFARQIVSPESTIDDDRIHQRVQPMRPVQ